jgi:hypothetical protein
MLRWYNHIVVRKLKRFEGGYNNEKGSFELYLNFYVGFKYWSNGI